MDPGSLGVRDAADPIYDVRRLLVLSFGMAGMEGHGVETPTDKLIGGKLLCVL
jgi:hypothetical protein